MPSSSHLDRRAFLQRAGIAGAGAVALTALGRRPYAHADEALAPFVHGVASGDPLADRVILWTRYSPATGSTDPVELTLRVYRDADLTDEVVVLTRTVGPDTDFCAKVDVTGLAAATTYYYQYTAPDGRVSLVGRTKTLPDPGSTVDRFRAAVVSCSNYTGGYFNGYAVIAEQDDVDIVLHLGDYVYEYGNSLEEESEDNHGDERYGPAELAGKRDHVPATEMVTLEDYRARHGNYKLDPDLRRLHQLFPFITTWDDHESTDNSWRDGAVNHQDDEGTWAERKAIAQRVYDEWMPIRGEDPAIIYRSFPIGDLADLIYLDTRLEGRDEMAGELLSEAGFMTAIEDPERTLISPTQLNWFGNELAASQQRGATWRIVGQQVMFMQWDAGQLADLDGLEAAAGQDAPQFPVRTAGGTVNPDAWDGYQAERERVFDLIDSNEVDNLVVLTGDIHTSWAADLPRDAGTPYAPPPVDRGYLPDGTGSRGVEFVTPSITSDNFNEIAGYPEGGSAGVETAILAENVHIKSCDLDRHGFMTLDITPERVLAEWFHTVTRVEPSTELHPFRPLRDAWVVAAGDNHLSQPPPTARQEVAANAEPQPAPMLDPTTGGPGGGSGGDTDDGAVEDVADLAATGGGTAALGAAALGLAAAVRLRNRRTVDAEG